MEAWGALADAVAAPPALYPGHLQAWAAAHAGPERLRAIAVWRGDRLAAVLPLVLAHSRVTTVGLHAAEETGIVAADDDAGRVAAEAALSIGLARLLLRPVEAGGLTDTALAVACEEGGATLLSRTVDEYPVIEVAGDWEDYWRGLSRNTRSDVSRRRRRLAERGAVTTEVLDGSTGLDAALDVAFGIEASGWKGRAGTALTARPADELHHRLLARWAVGRGWFRLTFLRLDGRPIAFHFSLQAHGILYPLKVGYAEDMAAYSPGKVLMAAEIERAFAEGLRRFDFSGSAADYKRRWTDDTRTMLELSAFPHSAAGRAALVAARARRGVTPAAKRARRALRRTRAWLSRA